jgi:hypothetical protein
MRTFSVFVFLIAMGAVLFVPASASYAQCNITDTGDHVCGNGAQGSQQTPPPTPGGQAIQSSPPAPPVAMGDVIDYSQTSTNTQRDVASNLTQESTRLQSGSCAQRTLAPNSTTSIPFVYDGSNSSMNIPQTGPQGGVTRAFISTMPGFDPQSRLAPGELTDSVSPCHAQANLYEPCGDGDMCLSYNNENSINMMHAETVQTNPSGYSNQCPLVPGERYFINIQNQGSSPICTAVGNGTNCPPCQVNNNYGWP